MRDCIAKGRSAIHGKGSAHPFAKLAEPDVLKIRDMHASGGVSLSGLASTFGVSHETVRLIVKRETWTHI
jgi:hypothetical protein